MENKSLISSSRRPRGNQSDGGNRNRQGNRSGGNRSGNRSGGNRGGGNRNGNNRNRSRRRPAPKPTAWQKFLQFISFGKLGQPKARSGRKPQAKPTRSAQKPAATQSAPKDDSKRDRRPRTEVTSGRLYVGNLTYATTEEELEELFKGFGNVSSAEVVTNSRTQQSKGFAFVEMGSIGEAKRAVDILDDQDFNGRKLIVSGARSEGRKDSDDYEDSPSADTSSSEDTSPAEDGPAEEAPEAAAEPTVEEPTQEEAAETRAPEAHA